MESIKSRSLVIRLMQLTILLSFVVTGCKHQNQYEAVLIRIAKTVSDNPEQALERLDSINPILLSDRDRHYYDFLTIKAKDKAFIINESDSLILDVIKYFETNPADPVYSEALYYGGRVNSDIGDYPTALQYYQNLLDSPWLSDNTSDLRSRTVSQTGALLEQLRLYEQAIPYYSEALTIANEECDSLSIVYAKRTLGCTYYNLGTMKENELDRYRYLNLADSILTETLNYPTSISTSFSAETQIILAAVKAAKGNLDSALTLVRNTPDIVNPHSRNLALAYSADIYREAGILDTAFMYAHELVISEDMSNKKTGYRIILSPEFRQMLHPDTLNRYYSEYKDILEAYFDDNRNELSLLQESQYNYTLHKREKEKAEKHNERLKWIITGAVMLVLILVIVLLYVKYRDKAIIIRMRNDLDNLEQLKHQLNAVRTREKEEKATNDANTSDAESLGLPTANNQSGLRTRLYNELMELYRQSDNISVPDEILTSDIYSRIRVKLEHNRCIDDEMFDELKATVLSVSPQFVNHLNILTQGELTKSELQLALLVKSGFSPSDLTILFSRSNGAIISRKKILGDKVLGKKESIKVITGIIRLL